MSEELLDDSDVHLPHQPGCEGVPEHVRVEVTLEDRFAVADAESMYGASGDRCVPGSPGEGVVLEWVGVADPVKLFELVDGLEGAKGEGDGSGLVVLGDVGSDVEGGDGLAFEPEIIYAESDDLGDAEAGVGDEGEEGVVPVTFDGAQELLELEV